MSIPDQNAFLRLARKLSYSKKGRVTFSLKALVKEADVPAGMIVVALVSLIERRLIAEAGKLRYLLTPEGVAESYQ